jgi:hypothetical protein
MHGIYAGDIDQLSAQTILGALRNFEHCGVLRGLLDSVIERKWPMFMDDFIAWSAVYRSSKTKEISPDIDRVRRKSSTFTLKGGTQQLAEGLKTALDKSGKVKIMTGTDIKAMTQRQGSDSINVSVSLTFDILPCLTLHRSKRRNPAAKSSTASLLRSLRLLCRRSWRRKQTIPIQRPFLMTRSGNFGRMTTLLPSWWSICIILTPTSSPLKDLVI